MGTDGFRILEERVVYQGHVIGVAEVTVQDPEGEVHTRDVVRHPGAVSVVAVDGDEILLVRQYRVPADEELWEIPAGKLDIPGEDLEACAHRELNEETGFGARQLRHLVSVYLTPGYSDELHHIFLATDLFALDEGARPDGAEEHHMVTTRRLLAEVPAMVASGELRDAKTILGCLMALGILGVA